MKTINNNINSTSMDDTELVTPAMATKWLEQNCSKKNNGQIIDGRQRLAIAQSLAGKWLQQNHNNNYIQKITAIKQQQQLQAI